jgi:hypothetical protein
MSDTVDDNILSFEQLIWRVLPNAKFFPPDLHLVFNLAVKLGIGEKVTRQKTKFKDSEIKKMATIVRWWCFYHEFSNSGWRRKESLEMLAKVLIESIVRNEPMSVVSIYCPSYKKGHGSVGYNSIIGGNTRRRIKEAIFLLEESTRMGVLINMKVFFSDLILENIDELRVDKKYLQDLDHNYKSFVDEFKKYSNNNVAIARLSRLNGCLDSLGEEGSGVKVEVLPDDIRRRIFERDIIFYTNNYGWSEENIRTRTNVIISSYLELSRILSKELPNSIILWVESNFERGLIYEYSPLYPHCVIYPKMPARVPSFFNDKLFKVEEVVGFSDHSRVFVQSLYEQEEVPVFEHNPFHVLSYLKFKYRLYKISSNYLRSILLVGKKEIIFFTPVIYDFESFSALVEDMKGSFPSFEIRIQNISQKWVDQNYPKIKVNCCLKPRSSMEVVYDVDHIKRLEGKRFANLRNLKNRMERNVSIEFRKLTEADSQSVRDFLDKWNEVQGHKYIKNRRGAEGCVYETALSYFRRDTMEGFFLGGFHIGVLVSLVLVVRPSNFTDWAIFYSIKGLNKKYGVAGASDVAYLKAFDEVQRLGVKWVNDGELGNEKGTAIHKMKFQPRRFVSSYDILLNNTPSSCKKI